MTLPAIEKAIADAYNSARYTIKVYASARDVRRRRWIALRTAQTIEECLQIMKEIVPPGGLCVALDAETKASLLQAGE